VPPYLTGNNSVSNGGFNSKRCSLNEHTDIAHKKEA